MRHEAIYNIHSNVVQIDDELGAFDKDGNSVTIDETKVAKEVKRLKAEFDANQYQRDRALAYDPIPEQLDQIYHDMDGWKAKIKAVKDKYPKP
tara:strand:+ start:526 stop:804 length:279 start_codon:yes stop_codon:yes gene_type:complete